MRICICLLWGILALPLQFSPAWADEIKHNDPDAWSSAFERSIAPHWHADEKVHDITSDRQFIVICDPDNISSYIHSLRDLASLQEDYLKNRKGWDEGKNFRYPCISRNSLRLNQHSGHSLAPPSGDDDLGPQDASYKVVKEDADSQIVELRFRDFNLGIYDSFFKYEIRKDKVIPMESWVVGRGLYAIFATELVVLILLLSAIVGLFKLFRFLKSRHARR
jgi:hypothetical protein